MKSRHLKKLFIVLALFAIAAFALSGCGGGGGGNASDTGTAAADLSKVTVVGNLSKDLQKRGILLKDVDNVSGTLTIINADNASTLGTGTIGDDGSFSVTFTKPGTQFTIVLKAYVTSIATTFRAIYSIDTTSPPTGLATNSVNLAINKTTDADVTTISKALGFATGTLIGDAAPPTGTTFTTIRAAMQDVNSAYTMAYGTTGLKFTGSVSVTDTSKVETCDVCHGATADFSINNAHGLISRPSSSYWWNGTTVDIGSLSPADLAGQDNITIQNIVVTNLDNATAKQPIVTFKVIDNRGNGIKGITSNLRFSLVKLVKADNVTTFYDVWQSYMVTTTSRPSTESPAAKGATPSASNGVLIDNLDGTYKYRFAKNVDNTTGNEGVVFDNSSVHRISIQLYGSNNPYPPSMAYNDFRPDGAAIGRSRIVVSASPCLDCHGSFTFHGGGRQDVQICNVCHTDQRRIALDNDTFYTFTANYSTYKIGSGNGKDQTRVVDNQTMADLPIMVHKIHMGNKLTLQGYNFANVLFNTIGYPQAIGQNCKKCHKSVTSGNVRTDWKFSSDNASEADYWKSQPSRRACGSCHDGIKWSTGKGMIVGNSLGKSSATSSTIGHIGGAQADDSKCSLCHTAASTAKYHASANGTTNASDNLTAAVNFKYFLDDVTVNSSNQAVVKFRIQKDTAGNGTFANVTFSKCDNTSTSSNLLSGFTAGPSFLLAYTMTQGDITTPADFNNLGRSAAQPASVTLLSICQGTSGNTITGPDNAGAYTATIKSSTFPSGAKMRTVGLQSYFTQTSFSYDNGTSGTLARHALSVVKTAINAGELSRRRIVDATKCGACHEWFEGHGGSRVIGVGNSSSEQLICVLCHVPNLSSSGRSASATDLAGSTGTEPSAKDALGSNSLAYPEEPQNFKDMIHGIHMGEEREVPFEFIRVRSSAAYYFNFGEVKFPFANAFPLDEVKSGTSYPTGNSISMVTGVRNCIACHVSSSSGNFGKFGGAASNTANFADGCYTSEPSTYNRAGTGDNFTTSTGNLAPSDGLVPNPQVGNLTNTTAGTYCYVDGATLKDRLLPSTVITTNGAIKTYTDVISARSSVPNDNDKVRSVTVSTCISCHYGTKANAHIEIMGGYESKTRK